jgi:hypothetical protein
MSLHLQVCQKERRDALEERDKLQLKLHEERVKRKKMKDDVSRWSWGRCIHWSWGRGCKTGVDLGNRRGRGVS